jgi:Domain of unknown function (DUF4345)
MKLGLQIILVVLSLIPAYFGITGMMDGAAMFIAPEQVTPALDSEFRFLSAYYLGLAVLIWWILPNIERHTTLFRIVIGALFLGGLTRVYSIVMVGAPPTPMLGGMALELALPLLILWQAKLSK